MFLDINNRFPRFEPPPPQPAPRKKLTRREEKTLLIAISLLLFLTVLAPIGGASIIQAFIK